MFRHLLRQLVDSGNSDFGKTFNVKSLISRVCGFDLSFILAYFSPTLSWSIFCKLIMVFSLTFGWLFVPKVVLGWMGGFARQRKLFELEQGLAAVGGSSGEF